MKLRHIEKNYVNAAATTRYQMSAVPFMLNLLNIHYREQEAHKNPALSFFYFPCKQ